MIRPNLLSRFLLVFALHVVCGTAYSFEADILYLDSVKDGVANEQGIVSDGLNAPIDLVISSKDLVYVAGYIDDSISVFRINRVSGKLEFQQILARDYGLNGVAALALSPDEQQLYATSVHGQAFTIFDIDGEGRLTHKQTLVNGGIDNNGVKVAGLGRFFEAGNTDINPTKDGRFVYISNRFTGGAAFEKDTATGLFVVSTRPQTTGVVGVKAFVISSDDQHIYSANIQNNYVVHHRHDTATGVFTEVSRFNNSSSYPSLADPTYVSTNPTGTLLVVPSVTNDSLVVFERDPANGSISYRAALTNGAVDAIGNEVSSLVAPYTTDINITGRKLVSANYDSNTIGLFTITPEGELLSAGVIENEEMVGSKTVIGMDSPRVVKYTKDGQYFIVSTYTSDSLYLFNDTDVDSDGLENAVDPTPAGEGVPNTEPDQDGDGVIDRLDAFPHDPNEWSDQDGDGVGDNSDAFPLDPRESQDSNADGLGDNGTHGASISYTMREPLAGVFSVDESGAAVYEIPIEIPPGINGFQPKLSLQYNSNKRKGDIRTGWMLSGLSSITRCPANYARDSFAGPVSSTALPHTQRFCLDGQPLVWVGGSNYGSDGSEYETEIRSPLRIKAFGQSGNGPNYFQVKNDRGETLTYGLNASERIEDGSQIFAYGNTSKFAWKLDSIEDRFGNKITYIYLTQPANGGGTESYLREIHYDTNIAGEGTREGGDALIRFYWSESPRFRYPAYAVTDSRNFYLDYQAGGIDYGSYATDGTIIRETSKLYKIEISQQELVRTYNLEYEGEDWFFFNNQYINPTPQILNLGSVTKCEKGGNCTSPARFQWDYVYNSENNESQCADDIANFPGGEPALSSEYIVSKPYTHNYDWDEVNKNHYSQVVGDFNGDDLIEMAVVYTFQDGSNSRITVDVAYSEGDGTFSGGSPRYTALIGGLQYNYRLAGDFNNDGYDDIVATNSSSSGWRAHVMLNDKMGSFAVPTSQTLSTTNMIDKTSFLKSAGDFNGDGYLDLIAFDVGFGDSDKNDLLFRRVSGLVAYVALGNGDGTFQAATGGLVVNENKLMTSYAYNRRLHLGDFNGDGVTDIATTYIMDGERSGPQENGIQTIVAFGNGNGTFSAGVVQSHSQNNTPFLFSPTPYQDSVKVADVNGDGLTDFVALQYTYGGIWERDVWYGGGSTQQVPNDYYRRSLLSFISNGDGRFTLRSYEDVVPAPVLSSPGAGCVQSDNFPIVADFNNDTFADVSYGSGVFYLGYGNGQYLKQGRKYVANDSVVRTGGGISMSGGAIIDTTYGSYAFDVNRDGNPDVVEVVVDKNGLTVGTNAYAANVDQQYISTINDGYNRTIKIEYEPIISRANYKKEGEKNSPYIVEGAGRFVVSKVSVSDGLGSSFDKTYQYKNLVRHARLHQLMGFEEVSVTDSRNQITETTAYHTRFPLAGLPLSHKKVSSNGVTLELTNYSWSYTWMDYGVIFRDILAYVPLLNESVHETRNDDGDLIGVTTKTYSYFDDYGNARRIISSQSDGYRQETSLTLRSSESWDNYYVGRLDRTITDFHTPSSSKIKTLEKTYVYYPNNSLKEEIIEPNDPNHYVKTEYEYDEFGRVVLERKVGHAGAVHPFEPREQLTSYEMPYWGGANGQTLVGKEMRVTVTNPMGHIQQSYIDVMNGKVLRSVDENQLTTSFTYDGFGDLTLSVHPNGTETKYARLVCDVHCPENAAFIEYEKTTGTTYKYSYFDLYGRTLRTRWLGSNGWMVYQDYEYDSLGREVYASDPYFVNQGPELFTEQAFDLLDRIVYRYSAKLGQSVFDYSALDGMGIKSTETKARVGLNGSTNLITERFMNLKGQSTYIGESSGSKLYIEYDGLNFIAKTTDAYGNSIFVEHDKMGNPIVQDDPDIGVRWSSYDALGQLRYQKDAKQNETTYNYDRLGRLIQRNKAEGTDRWTFDVGFNAIGKLTSESSAFGHMKTIEYNTRGLIERETHRLFDQDYRFVNGYDAFGRLNSVTYPTGFNITYDYSAYGYLENVLNGGVRLWHLAQLTAQGLPSKEVLGNGVTTDTTYAPASGYINRIHSYSSGTAIQDQKFDFDSLGNLERRRDSLLSAVETFSYDNANRLLNVRLNGVLTKSHSYDLIGNIKSKSDYGSDYRYGLNGGGPHAVSSVMRTGGETNNFHYDDNGNMIESPTAKFSYTSFNKPLTITKGNQSTSFSYDTNEMRVRKTSPEETVVYINPRWDSGVHFEVETRAGVVARKHYINAGNKPVALYTTFSNGPSKLAYLHKDHLGSVVAISTASGALDEVLSYQAFGARRNADWSDSAVQLTSANTHHGFTGHEHLDDLGLIHMNARLYDPNLGRFISADPKVPGLSTLDVLNRYTYVLNNPLSYTDPDGHVPIFAYFLILGALNQIAGDAMIGNVMDSAGATQTPANAAANPSGVTQASGSYGGTTPSAGVDSAGVYNSSKSSSEQSGEPSGGVIGSLADGIQSIEKELHTRNLGAEGAEIVSELSPISTAAEAVKQISAGGAVGSVVGQLATKKIKAFKTITQKIKTKNGNSNAAADVTSSAEARAKEIHSVLDSRAQKARTTSVTETVEGVRVVSSSERRLSRAQRAELRENEVEGIGVGHAEVTGINAAKEMGLTPIGTAASRPICTSCANTINEQGIVPLSPLKSK